MLLILYAVMVRGAPNWSEELLDEHCMAAIADSDCSHAMIADG
jgi:hypothetical protein